MPLRLGAMRIELSLPDRIGKISPQFVGIAATTITNSSGWMLLDARVDSARPGVAWNSRMGLFHCVQMTDRKQ